jgi:hypothetical protein
MLHFHKTYEFIYMELSFNIYYVIVDIYVLRQVAVIRGENVSAFALRAALLLDHGLN